jgi:CMP-2-keto-3-deoxyoctulosonic acid synthetase
LYLRALDRARWLAELRHSSLSELIAEAINKLAEAEPPKDRILGMFADEPEVADEMLEEISRHTHFCNALH